MYVCLSHSYEDGDPVSVRSRHVRPRARHKLSLADLTHGSRVMVNYNYDEPRRRGYWYDAVVTAKQVTRTNRQLTATVYIGYDSACVCLSHNYDKPRRHGYWYDAIVTSKHVNGPAADPRICFRGATPFPLLSPPLPSPPSFFVHFPLEVGSP